MFSNVLVYDFIMCLNPGIELINTNPLITCSRKLCSFPNVFNMFLVEEKRAVTMRDIYDVINSLKLAFDFPSGNQTGRV
jgi:hypothetical protein